MSKWWRVTCTEAHDVVYEVLANTADEAKAAFAGGWENVYCMDDSVADRTIHTAYLVDED